MANHQRLPLDGDDVQLRNVRRRITFAYGLSQLPLLVWMILSILPLLCLGLAGAFIIYFMPDRTFLSNFTSQRDGILDNLTEHILWTVSLAIGIGWAVAIWVILIINQLRNILRK